MACKGAVLVRDTAFNLLARREHSAFELKRKLMQRGYDPQAIDEVVIELKKEGYQSDERFLESFCRMKISQGYGIFYIVNALKQHQISQSKVKEFLLNQEIDWVYLAKAALKKHAWRFNAANKVALQAKKMRFLTARGFAKEVIKESLLYENS
ncbi:MAG: hypothetical protein A3F18_08205 [Legionellales bacterium RIFCSPHIGHO2_12_FULL_37_14]|nr:MAG: hypothetical protein A3F18_08205 [Legionellales bacterium RIFCSPHIGHO2_12_FULL_37_14]